MKKQLIFLVLFLCSFSVLNACGCTDISFLEKIAQCRDIVRVKALSLNKKQRTVTVIVLDKYKGQSKIGDTLTLTGGDGLNCNLTISAFTTKGEYIIVFSDATRYGHLPIYCAGEIAEIKNKAIEVRGKMYKLKGFSSLIAKKTRKFNKKYKKETAEILNSMKAAKSDSAKIHWIVAFRRNDYNAFLYFKTIIEDTTQSQELRSEALDNGVRYIRHEDVTDFAAKYLKEFPGEVRSVLQWQNNSRAKEILRKEFGIDTD